MAVGDQASAAGFALVPDTGEDGRVRYGAREINRSRDYTAQVQDQIPANKTEYGTAVGIKRGKVTISFTADNGRSGTVTFPNGAFADVPNVQLTVQVGSNFDLLPNIQFISSTGFGWRVFQSELKVVTGTATLHWIAIGA